MNVSPQFTPSLKLTLPYFLTAIILLIIFSFSLVSVGVGFDMRDFTTAAVVHLYLVGFVMMVIFIAMAQIVPVLVEQSHVALKVYLFMGPLLISGLLGMIYGFINDIVISAYASLLILLAMLLFAYDFILTIIKAKSKKSLIKFLFIASLFLLLGILSGFAMVLSYAGMLDWDVDILYRWHVSSLILGYILVTLMSVSKVLLNMFMPSRYKKELLFNSAVILIFVSLLLFYVAWTIESKVLELSAVAALFISILLYLIHIIKHYYGAMKQAFDIYAKHLLISVLSLAGVLDSMIFYTIYEYEPLIKVGFWLFFVGFIGFFIFAHMYKIIPFLVWFKRYAPIVDEQPVPFLHELVPTRLASLECFFSMLGMILITIAFGLENNELFVYGVYLLSMGFLTLFFAILKIVSKKQ